MGGVRGGGLSTASGFVCGKTTQLAMLIQFVGDFFIFVGCVLMHYKNGLSHEMLQKKE
jgi:hypothetical protein